MASLEQIIIKKRNSLKTDRLDMTFGEIMNMYDDGELFISPEYQRAFRWTDFQQTRFIESVLLGIPIPPIFVAEDDDGVWEVVDGLQRTSTILSFFGLLTSIESRNNLILTQGEMVRGLEGKSIEDLSVKLRTTIKRAVCRVEVVRWDSGEDVRYELFNRLNTGASPLSDQEIRNCIFRSYKVNLNQKLRDLASEPAFIALMGQSKTKVESMFLEELVLRYFAFKFFTSDDEIKTTVPQYLTDFMKRVSSGEEYFDLETESKNFLELIVFLNEKIGREVFRPNKGAFSQHIYESLAYSYSENIGSVKGNEASIIAAIDNLLSDEEYNEVGAASYSQTRMRKRFNRAYEIFYEAS